MFRAVVDCGGVNAAAAHLDIAQPSVTAHLRALEAQMGSALFVRSRGRKNLITPSGEALYKFACETLSRSAELHRAVRGFDADAAPAISIAVQRALGNYWLPKALTSFMRRRPTARLSIYSETQEAAIDRFKAGSVDAAIVFETPQTAHLGGQLIGAEPLIIVAAPGHALRHGRRIPLRDLESFDFVGGIRESQFFSLVETTLKASGLPRYRVVLHMQDSVAIKNAAAHGLGLACTLRCVVESEIKAGQLVAVETDPVLPSLPVKMIFNASELAKGLLDELAQLLAV